MLERNNYNSIREGHIHKMPYRQVDSKGLYDRSLRLQSTLLQPERHSMQHTTIDFNWSLYKTTSNRPFEKIVRKILHLAPFIQL